MCNHFSCESDMPEQSLRDLFSPWPKGFSFDYDEEITKSLGHGCSVSELKDTYTVNLRTY